MTRQSFQFIKVALFSSLIAIGAVSTTAAAGDGLQRHRHTSSCNHSYEPDYAGKITIDGYTSRIRADRPMLRQIATAFRKAGYRAWIDGNQVEVDYGYCKPSVRWSTDLYRANFNWSYGDLCISLRKHRKYSYRGQSRRQHRPIRVARRSIGWGYCD
ncbi:MAG: hypothetical protein P1U42_01700 [Phycisphaerales bacterium]|nr:hypothetical protein [Phycisphaerales bacterium]